MHHILVFGKVQKWTDKVDVKFHPILVKYVEYFFTTMNIGQPRYALVNCKPSNMGIMLLAYGDGSNSFSCGAVYIVSYDKNGKKFKNHLAVTASKMLQSTAKTGSVDSVPQREVRSALIASQLLYRVALTLTNLHIPVTSAYLCLDAISTLLAL